MSLGANIVQMDHNEITFACLVARISLVICRRSILHASD